MLKNLTALLNPHSTTPKHSKQLMQAKKMFGGSSGKTPRISKKRGLTSNKGIGMHEDAYDEMMNKMTSSKKPKKLNFFTKKSSMRMF